MGTRWTHIRSGIDAVSETALASVCGYTFLLASVWEYTFLLKTWDTVKDEDEPLIALLQLLSQQRPGGKGARGTGPPTKVKCLPVDPALYDHIFIPWPALALGKY
jgi:hypothetical protein